MARGARAWSPLSKACACSVALLLGVIVLILVASACHAVSSARLSNDARADPRPALVSSAAQALGSSSQALRAGSQALASILSPESERAAQHRSAGPHPRPLIIKIMLWVMYVILSIVTIYGIRHYIFTLNRMFGAQRHPYLDIDTADWPRVSVLIPAHNEERVIGSILEALLEVDYPMDRLRIVPIDDRSKDKTGAIMDEMALAHPGLIHPFHRKGGPPGKAAALRDAMPLVADDIILVFDADYIPGKGLIKQLTSPFFDPEVGAVMGRVVPLNVEENLLTRVLDLERTGGYQVDQQARMNMRLVAQYGGTVGGVRKRALQSIGGWRIHCLAEDTDVTFRLLLDGWKTAYQNRSECYEQVPNTWKSRIAQIFRWARGHNQVLSQYAHRLLGSRRVRFGEKLDGLLLLNVYMLSLIVVLGWFLGIALWYLGVNKPGLIVILIVVSYSTLGNFAAFFEVSAASRLDGSRNRVRLLPFLLLGFLISLWSVSRATLTHFLSLRSREELRWHKTEHNNHNKNHLNGNGNGYNDHNGNGRNGYNNHNGHNGRNGYNGRNGRDGLNGHNGHNGRNGYTHHNGDQRPDSRDSANGHGKEGRPWE